MSSVARMPIASTRFLGSSLCRLSASTSTWPAQLNTLASARSVAPSSMANARARSITRSMSRLATNTTQGVGGPLEDAEPLRDRCAQPIGQIEIEELFVLVDRACAIVLALARGGECDADL